MWTALVAAGLHDHQLQKVVDHYESSGNFLLESQMPGKYAGLPRTTTSSVETSTIQLKLIHYSQITFEQNTHQE